MNRIISEIEKNPICKNYLQIQNVPNVPNDPNFITSSGKTNSGIWIINGKEMGDKK